MNEDRNKSIEPNPPLKLVGGNPIPNHEDHPLHILHNQIDPELKKKLDIPQKPLRTYEMDLDDAFSHLDKSQVPKKFKSVFSKTKIQENPLAKEEKNLNIGNLQKLSEELRKPEPIIRESLQEVPKIKIPEIKIPVGIPMGMTAEEKPKLTQENLRTYEGDVADTLTSQKSSISTIIIAENKRKTERSLNGDEFDEEKPRSQIGKKIAIIFISILFIFGGVGGGYYLYLKSPVAIVPVIQTKDTIPKIINPDSQNIAPISSLKKEKLIAFVSNQFNSQKISAGKLVEIVPTQTIGAITKKVTGSEFITSMDFNIIDTLKRSFTDKWMLGVYSSNGREISSNLPFIIFTTDFFQNTYAGMLKWEPDMPEDLADIFGYRQQATSSINSLYKIKGSFKDKIIANRDVREFTNKDGNVLFIYSFIDKNTLVITTSEDVITALLDRIEKQTYIR